MKMTFRWYGEDSDPIKLKQIRQIPGMTGLMGLLDYKAAGEVWTEEEIKAYMEHVHASGLECEVIESVNVHEDIKMGLPTRDKYIENYITTIRNLAKYGVKVIIYNFMPVLDWLRTDLAREIPEDGSNSLYFDEKDLGEMTPLDIVKKTAGDSNGFSLPGWEPERLAELEKTLKQYENITARSEERRVGKMIFAETISISLMRSFRYVKRLVSRWHVIRMIRPGRSSVFRESLTARRISIRSALCMIHRQTDSAFALVHLDPIRTTISRRSSVTLVR